MYNANNLRFHTELYFVLRNAVDVLQRFFTSEEEFMELIVVKLRECYDGWLSKKPQGCFNSLSSFGTKLEAVKKVSLLYLISPLPPPTNIMN